MARPCGVFQSRYAIAIVHRLMFFMSRRVLRHNPQRKNGVITKGVSSLEESLKSLNSLESLENGRTLLCLPQAGDSLESHRPLENDVSEKSPFPKAGSAKLSTTTAREQNRALGPRVYGGYPNPENTHTGKAYLP